MGIYDPGPAVRRAHIREAGRALGRQRGGRAGVRWTVIALLVLAAGLVPRTGEAQVTRTAIGLVGGLMSGVHMSTGIFVLRARAYGFNMHTAEDILSIRPETMPILVMPVAGAILGYRSSTRLAGAATWGGVGLAGGALAGATIGHFVWGTSDGRWAGGTIGSAAGLALGSVLGALLTSGGSEDGDTTVPAPLVTFSLPIGRVR